MDIMKKYRFSSFEFHLFLILLAIEVLMSFTFFGYIHFPPVSITFAYIPILIAACVLGTKESTVLGAVFGLASMYKSTVHSAQPVDMLFSPVLSGKPVSSLVMALGVRILFGFLAGILRGEKVQKIRFLYWRCFVFFADCSCNAYFGGNVHPFSGMHREKLLFAVYNCK